MATGRLVQLVLAVMFATFGGVHATAEHNPKEMLGVLSITSPPRLATAIQVYFSTFSKLPASPESLKVWVPNGDPEGCTGDMPATPAGHPVVAVLRRGTCDFVQKSLRVQAAGAAGIIIVDDSDDGDLSLIGIGSNASEELFANALKVDIIVVGVTRSMGDSIVEAFSERPTEPVVIEFEEYKPRIGMSEVLVVWLSTALVVAGAFFATADMRAGSPIAPAQGEEILEIPSEAGPMYCVMGSLMLVVLFFLMKYLIYIVMILFCLGSFGCLVDLFSVCLAYLVPATRKRLITFPVAGPVTSAELVCLVPSALICAGWVVLRNSPYGWIPQDIMGACLLCMIQKTLRMPNAQVATILLSAMFFFDIFWVFISPLIFKQSVMVSVATGGDTGEHIPMVFRIPAIGDPFGNERILGFGDIVIPGLLVSFLRRFDIKSGKSGCAGYFVPSVIGYMCGIICTLFALVVMRLGQPALLYLVPGTLGTTLVLGAIRGESRSLWDGKYARVADSSYQSP